MCYSHHDKLETEPQLSKSYTEFSTSRSGIVDRLIRLWILPMQRSDRGFLDKSLRLPICGNIGNFHIRFRHYHGYHGTQRTLYDSKWSNQKSKFWHHANTARLSTRKLPFPTDYLRCGIRIWLRLGLSTILSDGWPLFWKETCLSDR